MTLLWCPRFARGNLPKRAEPRSGLLLQLEKDLALFEGGDPLSPLTPALSPKRGEGEQARLGDSLSPSKGFRGEADIHPLAGKGFGWGRVRLPKPQACASPQMQLG